ncbi:hypothetical protein ACIBSW_07040 [Actinoplanes sp. NPDC049668]|uniref:hypothetical protein n=1 Tax=unclassified Actinoplanes TaxID=2626549 RepID=UPI0033A762CC
MSIRALVGRGLIATAVIATTMVGTAVAAEAAVSTLEVKAGRLVLEPGARGYVGSLPVTITYRGDAPDYANFTFVEPVAGAFDGLTPSDACLYLNLVDGRRGITCGVPGGDLKPGKRRHFTIDFEVLTTPRPYAMQAADTTVDVSLGSQPDVRATASSKTLFRSTTGTLVRPRPYVQDTQSDITVTTGNATLTAQEDGTYAGRVPVTIHWAGDAPHEELTAQIQIPSGFDWIGTDPSEPCAGNWCSVPGGRFMAGETRTFDLLATAPAEAVPGTVGTGSVSISTNWRGNSLPDVDPSDNTAPFTLTVG